MALNPQTFELAVADDGAVTAGRGIVAAFVPAGAGGPAVAVVAADPRQDADRPVESFAGPVVGHIHCILGRPAELCWAFIDKWGRFFEARAAWVEGMAVPMLDLQRFGSGGGVEGFLKAAGGPGEIALELLSALVEVPRDVEETPTMREFLEAVEAHGNLPAPGALFHKVEAAAVEGDIKAVASAIQADPVISASLINYANAARFAAARKTGSVPEAVQRLGTAFVRRVVFVAEMMARYRQGACAAFDYQGYWLNAIATGAAMRGLMARYGLPERQADEAFTVGLVSGIGWLAVAETFPALMSRYLERARGGDPIVKARAHNEIFPAPIRKVSEVFLARYAFPEIVLTTVAGQAGCDRAWYDCLASAARVAQALAFFDCLPMPATAEVPAPCREEWQRWQGMAGR